MQILGFKRRRSLSRLCHDVLFGSRLSGVRRLRQRRPPHREQERGGYFSALQKVLAGAAQVAMAQVGGVHFGLAGSGKLGQHAAEKRAANIQRPPIGFREGNPGQVQRRQPRLGDWECSQILRHERALLELAGGFRQPLAELGKLGQQGSARTEPRSKT